MMNAIVCTDINFGIGRRGKLLVNIPSDKKRFYELTRHKTVIYGRKTLQTLPGGKPLTERENIILSKNSNFLVYGATMARSVDELKDLTNSLADPDIFVIGGQSIYNLLLPMCDKIYLTKINRIFDADSYFPNLNANQEFKKSFESERFQFNDWDYTNCIYERI